MVVFLGLVVVWISVKKVPFRAIASLGIWTKKLAGSASSKAHSRELLQCLVVLVLGTEELGKRKQSLFLSASLLETQ